MFGSSVPVFEMRCLGLVCLFSKSNAGSDSLASEMYFMVWFSCFGNVMNGVLSRFQTVFLSYHGDNSHYSCLSWLSLVLVLGSEVSCPMALPPKNTQRVKYGSNPGPYYESNTLPLSHIGPLWKFKSSLLALEMQCLNLIYLLSNAMFGSKYTRG